MLRWLTFLLLCAGCPSGPSTFDASSALPEADAGQVLEPQPDAGVSLVWSLPYPGTVLSGVAPLRLSGRGLTHVVVFLGQKPVASCTVTAGTEALCSLDTLQFDDGPLSLTARDPNAESRALSVTIANGGPTTRLRWSEPPQHQIVTGTITLELTGSGLASVRIFHGGSMLMRCALKNLTSASCSLDTRTLSNGPATLTAQGFDNVMGEGVASNAGPLRLNVANTYSVGWSPLTVLALENPMNHDGGLQAAIDALPDGGIVYLPEGMVFNEAAPVLITTPRIKLWAPNRQATLTGAPVVCRAPGCGFFGLKVASALSAEAVSLVEIEGCEVAGSAGAGVHVSGTSSSIFINGNSVHHTASQHILLTGGVTSAAVWNNTFFNDTTALGDDGLAAIGGCSGPGCTRCGELDWFGNAHLGSPRGGGFSVIGCENVTIHDNWSLNTAGAGVAVRSDDSAISRYIVVRNNVFYQCAPNMLISGGSTSAALSDVQFIENVAVDGITGNYTSEGNLASVTNNVMRTARADLPSSLPSLLETQLTETATLRTQDTSFVPAAQRVGLFRIHVRQDADGSFRQRFEYIVKGPVSMISAWVSSRIKAGDTLAEMRPIGSSGYALVLTAQPQTVPMLLSPVTFSEMRDGDEHSGALSWLWRRVATGTY